MLRIFIDLLKHIRITKTNNSESDIFMNDILKQH